MTNTPDLETCKRLKEAGFPQKGAREYWARRFGGIAKSYAIPTLTPLLDWLVKDFTEQWARHRNKIHWGFKLIRDSYHKLWSAEMWYDILVSDDCELISTNPDPLTAVLELFNQMWGEMNDDQ